MTAAASISAIPSLDRPVTSLAGVGPERAAQLARLGVIRVEDLLLHRPRRYEDRRRFQPIAELPLDRPATTRGKVVAHGVKWYKARTRSIYELILDDGTAWLHCRWWNLPFMEKYFAVGDEVVVFGKLLSLKPRTMDHPETEVEEEGEENFIHFNRLTPVYPLTEGLPQRWLRSLIWRTLGQLESQIADPWRQVTVDSVDVGTGSAETKGTELVTHTQRAALPLDRPLLTRRRAVRLLHFPEDDGDEELARCRLALDEFVALQKQLLVRRRNLEAKSHPVPCGGHNQLIKPFLARLGFKLTDAQTQVLRELRKDLSGPHPMRRLLQGDVGSGKTVVAACSALMALESGYNVALMAPTEILADQHFRKFTQWFTPLGIAVELATGSRKTRDMKRPAPAADQAAALESAARGADSRTLYIGTHALLTPGFELPDLGLVIIDEQHKFGVAQREQLVRKGHYPHLLVMTATPIPRTLGLTIYGELDISVIDQMPAGRGRMTTFVRSVDRLPKVWAFIGQKLAEGRQAFVVYPRVEERGLTGLKAVTKEFEKVEKALAPARVGLLHGRLPAQQKNEVMEAFRAGTIRALLTTSLIEVGIDVPNATIMLIENAECFGLAQLHQLRGRIGRGAHGSYCILVAATDDREASARLRVLEQTNNGFRIAEEDLKLRGPGEFLGQEQSGAPRFRFGELALDLPLILAARRLAPQLLGE